MNKFIVWGHRGTNHTHSYIHESYQKAFESIGWESYWLNPEDDLTTFDFSNSLILTEGQVDKNIPLRKDCKYVLHNCNNEKYNVLDYISLQVYTNDVISREVEKISDFIYYQNNAKTLYQPWATDLLPSEINLLESLNFSNEKIVYWIGSIWGGEHGNQVEINQLIRSLEKRGLKLENPRYVGNKEYVNRSYISPSIQGKWQVDKGYIPCRIFKNISYGEFGITNSKSVYDLFNGSIVYDNNIESLVEKSIQKRENIKLNELNDQISFVKDNHTYINRIKNILDIWS
jgi:hypothetical protein